MPGTKLGVRRRWRKHWMIPLALVAILGANLGVAAAVESVDERAKVSYRVQLSGADEVPPVATQSTGRAALTWAVHGDFLRYEVQILDSLDGVTQAHIHVGAPGVNGPVVAFLYGLVDPTDIGRQVLSSGFVRPENLVGPFAGDWDGFVTALEAGELYINVHTATNPAGEIRGQILRAREGRDSTTTLPPSTTSTTTTVPPTTTTTIPPTTTTTIPPTTTTTIPPTTTTTIPPTTTTTIPPTTTTTIPPTTTTTMPPTQTEATMFEFDFEPDPIVVPVGRTVRWTNIGGITHTSTSPDGGWDSGFLGTDETYSFTMNQEGTFDYFCTLHPGMEGTVVVGSR